MNQEDGKKRSISGRGFAMFAIVIVILGANCLFLTLMISKSVVINQENQILLQRILAIASNNQETISKLKINGIVSSKPEQDNGTPQPPQKLVQLFNSLNECPPCPTTPKPDPIEGHLNPVGILNDLTHHILAQYDCVHSCVHPVTHNAYLTVDDPDFVGKSWHGIGTSKALSKHSAAYKALQEEFPDEAATIPAQNIPPDYNPGPCQRPPPKSMLLDKGTTATTMEKTKQNPYELLLKTHNITYGLGTKCYTVCKHPRQLQSNLTVPINIHNKKYFVAYGSPAEPIRDKAAYLALVELYPDRLDEVEMPDGLSDGVAPCPEPIKENATCKG